MSSSATCPVCALLAGFALISEDPEEGNPPKREDPETRIEGRIGRVLERSRKAKPGRSPARPDSEKPEGSANA